MSNRATGVRRHILGVIAMLLLAGWIYGLTVADLTDGRTRMLASVCMRAGLVLGALWLALPQVAELLARYPLWLIGLLSVGLAAVVYRPRLLLPALVVLGLVYLAGVALRAAQPPPPRRKTERKGAPRQGE